MSSDNQAVISYDLHRYLCSSNISIRKLKSMINNYPNSLSTEYDDARLLPIHIAISKRLSVEIIDILAKAYPQGLRMRCKRRPYLGMLPIHIACSKHFKREVINYLVEMYPESLCVQTSQKLYPIQLVFSSSFTSWTKIGVDFLMKLILLSPKSSLFAANRDGNLIIHMIVSAPSYSYSYSLVRFILNIHPECMHVKNKSGYDAASLILKNDYNICAYTARYLLSRSKDIEVMSVEHQVLCHLNWKFRYPVIYALSMTLPSSVYDADILGMYCNERKFLRKLARLDWRKPGTVGFACLNNILSFL